MNTSHRKGLVSCVPVLQASALLALPVCALSPALPPRCVVRARTPALWPRGSWSGRFFPGLGGRALGPQPGRVHGFCWTTCRQARGLQTLQQAVRPGLGLQAVSLQKGQEGPPQEAAELRARHPGVASSSDGLSGDPGADGPPSRPPGLSEESRDLEQPELELWLEVVRSSPRSCCLHRKGR